MNSKKAFSLIEVAVILIIIGLIVAALAIGEQLIRQAKLKTIVTDLKNFKVAIDLFDQSYDSLPGDITNASSFWPVCTNQSSPVVNNCNGNGDLTIQELYEGMRMWEHISLAKLIDNNYVGKDTIGTGNQFNPDENAPALPMGQGCYGGASAVNSAIWYGLSSNIIITLGATSTNASCQNGAFTPKEAFYLDTKIDDGMAETGRILSTEGDAIKTSNPNDCSNGDYNLSINSTSCRTIYDFSL